MSRSSHCNQFRPAGQTRREILRNAACGFGAVALSSLMADPNYAGLAPTDEELAPEGDIDFARFVHYVIRL